jgi:hypothetical protein
MSRFGHSTGRCGRIFPRVVFVGCAALGSAALVAPIASAGLPLRDLPAVGTVFPPQ